MEVRVLAGEKEAPAPKVSIILPTYNRAAFLPQALKSVRSQKFTDWELIIVDDGSTDNTREALPALCEGMTQPVRCIHQENQGAYGARNTGLDAVRGEYIAFYDSDDVWLPHHLDDCVQALRANPDVDWVYGASQSIEYASGQVLHPNVFYVEGRPRPFLGLHSQARDGVRVIHDPKAAECMILHGLYAGLQCSVIRREVFDGYRFEAASRNEAEDQLVVVEALVAGRRLAYYDKVHVLYYVHAQNSSAAGIDRSVDKHLRIFGALVDGYEKLRGRLRLTPPQQRALARRLAREYFWNLGYVQLQAPGQGREALQRLRRGLYFWPWSLRCWKTYLLAQIRVHFGQARPSQPSSLPTW
jgi:glycosyltransferase involved in cell wall biosynthesis